MSGSTTGGSTGTGGSGPGVVGPVGGAVPTAFVPSSATFVSSAQGWVLGTAPCSSPPCTSLVRTTDGGRTWRGIPAPRVSLATTVSSGAANTVVSSVRFADATHGWVFGGALYATTDGGSNWHSVPITSASRSVSDLQSSGGYAWAVLSCTPSTCTAKATSTVLRARVGTDTWTIVGAPVPTAGRGRLLVHGGDAWVYGTAGVWHGTGAAWTALAAPCAGVLAGLSALTEADAHHLDALCTGNGGAGSIEQQLRGTSNGGRTWVSNGPVVVGPSDVNGVADNGRGVLIVADSSGSSYLHRTLDDGAHFTDVTPSGVRNGGYPWSDLGFTTADQGVVVERNFSLFLTRDAGATWSRVSF